MEFMLDVAMSMCQVTATGIGAETTPPALSEQVEEWFAYGERPRDLSDEPELQIYSSWGDLRPLEKVRFLVTSHSKH